MNTLEDAFINIGMEDKRYEIKIDNLAAPDCFSKSLILINKIFY